jgi:hypothetical protein
MRGQILTASQFYLTGAVWFAILVGTTLGYVRFVDIAFATFGVDVRLAGVFVLAMGATSATAAAWIVWTVLRSPRALARATAAEHRDGATVASMFANGSGS